MFLQAKQKVIGSLSKVIILDEAQRYMTPEKDHIINRLACESRKFGLGMFLSSQNIQNIAEDVLVNCGTKMLLGDEFHHDLVSRRLGVEQQRLRFITPQQTALIQIKTKAEMTQGKFVEMQLAA